MSDVLKVTIHVEIDRETGDIRWKMDGIENGSTDAGLLYQALVRVLDASREGGISSTSVH